MGNITPGEKKYCTSREKDCTAREEALAHSYSPKKKDEKHVSAD
jgi:hypothetical protein